jgi:hypothetical protein
MKTLNKMSFYPAVFWQLWNIGSKSFQKTDVQSYIIVSTNHSDYKHQLHPDISTRIKIFTLGWKVLWFANKNTHWLKLPLFRRHCKVMALSRQTHTYFVIPVLECHS